MRIARLLGFSLLALGLFAIPVPSRANDVSIGISVRVGPPVLPVYAQPICPGDGYIWTPGYWAYADDGYFWVPGTWVMPPSVGLLWTPGYWGWSDGLYNWHAGYWGEHVGFYGGVDYGFGYPGTGFYGGRWDRGHFFYNRSVANVNVNIIHNTYNTRVNNVRVSHVSYNGGPGGINSRPNSAEVAAARDRHVALTSEQTRHRQMASSNRDLRASVNHGHPTVAATPRAGQFNARGGAVVNRPNDRVNRPTAAQPRENARVNPNANTRQQQATARTEQRQSQQQEKAQQKQAQNQAKTEQRQAQEQRKATQQQEKQQQQANQQRATAQRQQQTRARQQQARQRPPEAKPHVQNTHAAPPRQQPHAQPHAQPHQQKQTPHPAPKHPSNPDKPHDQ